MAGRVVCLLLPMLSSATATSLSDPAVREHYLRVHAFLCVLPRPSVVPLTELTLSAPGPVAGSKYYLPEATVLHRCDAAAGCCGPGLTCGPAVTETVLLPFLVIYMVDVVGHPRNSSEVESVAAVNHTRCECLPRGLPHR